MASSRNAAVPAVDFLSAFASAASEIGSRIPSCDLTARVPACPRWTSYDLIVHLGNIHAWAATIVETGRSTPQQNDQPASRRPRVVAEWYVGKAGDLLAVLRAASPGHSCWTFSAGDRTACFWQRRQAHEALVHLFDLHQAQRGTTDLPVVLPEPGATARLAADGIAEVLEVFLPRMHARGHRIDLEAPLLLDAADTADRWLLTPTPEAPPRVQPVTGTDLADRGTDRVTAPALDLMMLLWRRRPADAAEVTLDGDRERLLRFLASPLTA